MISVIYTIAAVLLIIYLSFKVINLRRARRISVGDGNNQDLEFAREASLHNVQIQDIRKARPVKDLHVLTGQISRVNIPVIAVLGFF